MKTRRLVKPWPFLFSVTARGLVQNLPPKERKPKLSRLKRVKPADQRVQESLA